MAASLGPGSDINKIRVFCLGGDLLEEFKDWKKNHSPKDNANMCSTALGRVETVTGTRMVTHNLPNGR